METKQMNNVAVVNCMTIVRANVIAQRSGSLELGITKAMMIELLKSKMKDGVAHFYFQKKDGSVREAWGTLNESLIKPHINGNGVSREVYKTTCFWDCAHGGFRSFRWDSIIKVL